MSLCKIVWGVMKVHIQYSKLGPGFHPPPTAPPEIS